MKNAWTERIEELEKENTGLKETIKNLRWEGGEYQDYGHIQCAYSRETDDPDFLFDFQHILDVVEDWEVVVSK